VDIATRFVRLTLRQQLSAERFIIAVRRIDARLQDARLVVHYRLFFHHTIDAATLRCTHAVSRGSQFSSAHVAPIPRPHR